MANYFSRGQNQSPYFPQSLPKNGKHRLRQASKKEVPPHAPQDKAPEIAHPDVPAADPEAQIHPGPHRPQKEAHVPQDPASFPQGGEKLIIKPQPGPQCQGPHKTPGRLPRGHPKSLWSQPSARGSW